MLPQPLREAWLSPQGDLFQWATHADTRKHTDTLEAERHYLDVDDLASDSLDVWGLPWEEAQKMLLEDDSNSSPRRFGVLPWELERAYRRLVWAWAPPDSSSPNQTRINRAAADLGHYLADAHVPLHTSGNYNGQRSGQLGIHALWETTAVEWMLRSPESRTCPPCHEADLPLYDPVWTPWEIIEESHQLLPNVFAAEIQWQELCGKRGYGFERRGRTLQLTASPEALDVWDSLTARSTWPRFCLTRLRIASAWHSAWMEAGQPKLEPTKSATFWQIIWSYLPQEWPWFGNPNRTP